MESSNSNNSEIRVVKIVDEDYELELVARITDSPVYKKRSKKLPTPRMIAYLYIKDNMACLMNDTDDGLIYITVKDINSFIEQLYNRAIVDLITIKRFVSNFSKITNSPAQDGNLRLSSIDSDRLLTALEDVHKHYWERKLSGALDPAIAVILVFSNHFIHKWEAGLNTQVQAMVQAFLSDADNKKRIENRQPLKKLRIEKASDLTIIIDYSLDKNKYNASYSLKSGVNSTHVTKLLDCNLSNFLRENVIDPLTLTTYTISPGTTTDIDNWECYRSQYPSMYHINNINSQIRKYVDSSKKLKFFKRSGRTITVQCKIIVHSQSKKDRFGRNMSRT